MNKFTFLLALAVFSIFSSYTAEAMIFTCSSKMIFPRDHVDDNSNILIIDSMEAACKNQYGRDYSLTMQGFGLGLRVSDSYFALTCPFVKRKRFQSTAFFYGLKVSAGLAVGADVAIVSNRWAGLCFLTGFQIGLGASVSGGTLIIEPTYDDFAAEDVEGSEEEQLN